MTLAPSNKDYKAELKEWWGQNCDSKSDKTTEIYKYAETQKSKLFSDCIDLILENLKKIPSLETQVFSDGTSRKQIKKVLEAHEAKKIFAAYLRLNSTEIGDSNSYTYVKASMLDKDAKVELPEIEPYINIFKTDGVDKCIVYFTKITNTTINVSCNGAKKSADFRIKFGGSVPSAFKIDGSNNPHIMNEMPSNTLVGGAKKQAEYEKQKKRRGTTKERRK